MPKNTNTERALSAYEAVQRFSDATGTGRPGVLYDEAEFVVSDLLSALRHMCDREAIDFDDANQRAERLYEEECDDA